MKFWLARNRNFGVFIGGRIKFFSRQHALKVATMPVQKIILTKISQLFTKKFPFLRRNPVKN
jgi:hypothetical protein